MAGHGRVSLVGARWDMPGAPAGEVEVLEGGVVAPHLKGRAYFADDCTPGTYDYEQYDMLVLLGKTLRYTTHLAGAGCGCNGALYLTSMRQNINASDCQDYYCDAKSVCGVVCTEIDIQEANQYAWHSSMRVHDDGTGVGKDYGGYTADDWTAEEYGPNGTCVNTSLPIDVAVSFPTDDQGQLLALEVALSQGAGYPCWLSVSLDRSRFGRRSGMVESELSTALAAGMTPVVSYWSSAKMVWLDGEGYDGHGPCAHDRPGSCAESIRFYDFSIEPIVPMASGPYNCEVTAGDSGYGWPASKKNWCCLHHEGSCFTVMSPSPYTQDCAQRQRRHMSGLSRHLLSVGGVQREFVLYMPASRDAGAWVPLWVVAPGSGTPPSKQMVMASLLQAAEEEQFVFAVLRGVNDSLNVRLRGETADGKHDDIVYTKAVIAEVRRIACVDTRRIFCTGYSRGARFCSHLVSDIPGVFAAIAPVAGVRYPSPCYATRPVPVIAFHGLEDGTNAFRGGGQTYWDESVPTVVSRWVQFNGCNKSESQELGSTVAIDRHTGCKAGADVVLVRVKDAGHTWPGSVREWQGTGPTNHDIKATLMIAAFFRDHPLPALDPGDAMSLDTVLARADEHRAVAVALAVLVLVVLVCCLALAVRGLGGARGQPFEKVPPLASEVSVDVVDIAGKQTHRLLTPLAADVASLKEQITATSGMPSEEQLLFYNGRALGASQTLDSLRLGEQSVVYLARRIAGRSPSRLSSAASSFGTNPARQASCCDI